MKTFLHNRFFVLIFVFIGLHPLKLSAATITAVASGNWSNPSVWQNTPRSGFITTSTGSPNVNGSATTFLTQVTAGNILKDASNTVIGTVLSVNSNTSITLTTNAASSNFGISFNTQGAGSGDAVVIPGGINITVDKPGLKCTSLSLGSGGAGNSSLLFNAGAQLTAAGIVTIGTAGHTGSINMTSGGVLSARGFVISNAGSWSPGTGTIELTGPNTLPTDFFAGLFRNLTISNGNVTTSGVINISGNLSMNGSSGSVFSTGYAITVTGTTTVGASAVLTFTSAADPKIFNGLVTIANTGTWDNSIVNSPVIFHGGISCNGDFKAGTDVQTFNTNNQILSGSIPIPNMNVTGVIVTNNSALTIDSALNGSGTLMQGLNATLNLNLYGTPAISQLITTATGNTVNYGAAGPQTVFPNNYYHLTLSNAGVKTLQTTTSTIAADLSIKGTVSLTALNDLTIGGSLNTAAGTSFDAGSNYISIGAFLNNSGVFNAPGGSTVDVGIDFINKGDYSAGDASVTNVNGNFSNLATFNGGNGSMIYISGNAKNTGTLNAGNSTVELNGSVLQTLTSTGTGSFNNLTVNNTGNGLRLLSDITVLGNLEMTQGNIDLNRYVLQIGSSSLARGSLNRTDGTITGIGKIKRWYNESTIAEGSQDGLYPVGNNIDYRPFYVSIPIAPDAGGSMTLNYNDSTGSTPVAIPDSDRILEAELNMSWNLATGDGLSGGDYNLRIEGTGYGTFTNVDNWRIALDSGVVGSPGINAGTLLNPEVNRLALTQAELNNTFFLAYTSGSGTTLSFLLLSFNAYPVNREVKIDWETGRNFNSDYFTVLRSTGSSFWEVVATVSGAAHLGTRNLYAAYDKHPHTGLSYYKLQQITLDGKIKNSGIVSVNFAPDVSFVLYPNPATNFILLTTPDAGKLTFRLLNSIGQQMQVHADVLPGSARLDISSLSKGVYYIQTVSMGVQETHSFIKK